MGLTKKIGFATLALAASGCAAYEIQPLGVQHPAHGQAANGYQPPRSQALVYTRADLPLARPMANAAAVQQDGHDMHQMGSSVDKMVTGEGKVVATVPSSSQMVVEHGEIKGFMDAMTMGYRVEPATLLDGLKPGDQVHFSIDVSKKTIVKIEKK